MFFILKRKFFVFFCIVVLSVSSVIVFYNSKETSTPINIPTVVVDAGHGGIDGGTVGEISGKDENFLNLKYAKCLKEILEKYGIKVVMTRNDYNGLYSIFATDKKLDDMKKRKEIIEKSKADMVISIHMNSFPLKSCKGAQVFYCNDNYVGEKLADCIQKIFILNLPDARKEALVGDYYILNCTPKPAVIIECGYLSNPDEEKLLIDDDYMLTVCCSIFVGMVEFLSQ